MILVGSQRGGASDLATHLLKDENDHVEVHEVRGFASDDLREAFLEAHAISKGTRCQQFLYSLSLNPPETELVSVEVFERAIAQAEERLGLTGQPRAIVFHEKEGRRHAHVVWSRIKADEMKAVQMSFSHAKLNRLARELYIEHGWKMPPGLADSSLTDPRNFTLAEWQQAKRSKTDPRLIKTAFQDAWAVSDSKAAFEHALEEHGFRLARGDKKSFVAVDCYGEVYSVARQARVKTKEVKARLGEPSVLPSVEDVQAQLAEEMEAEMKGFRDASEVDAAKRKARLAGMRKALIQRQRTERAALRQKQEARHADELRVRQARFRTGLKGVWDRLRGEHKRIREQNEAEAAVSLKRDRAEKDGLTQQHLTERRGLKLRAQSLSEAFREQREELRQDFEHFRASTPRNRGPTWQP